MNVNDFLKLMAYKLQIDNKILLNSISKKITEDELKNYIIDDEKKKKIYELLNIDSRFVKFENKLSNTNSINNFKKLKENIGQLQILILIKNLSKSNNCDEIIKTLLDVLNNKFNNINEILKDDLEQIGGTKYNYYNKYIKYKTKYIKLNI